MRPLEDSLQTSMKEAMACLASGVSIVTSWIEGRPWGMTVSACSSLSLSPPLVLACLANGAVSTRAIMERGCFGLNILAVDQLQMAEQAATLGQPKFIDDLVTAESEMGSPIVKGALAAIHCELYNALVIGDHTVVVGEVGDVVLGTPRLPLVYFERQFLTLEGQLRSSGTDESA